MIEAFLIAALALPMNKQAEYDWLVKFVEYNHPDYQIVLVNEDEKLLGPVRWTPLYYKGLKVWLMRSDEKPKIQPRKYKSYIMAQA